MLRGRIEAATQAEAQARLQAQGRVLLSLDLDEGSGWRSVLTRDVGRRHGLPPAALARLTGRLAALLAAGLQVEAALALLVADAEAGVQDPLAELLRHLRGGTGLAEAMAADTRSFPPMVVAMVRAGEANGALAETLARLAEHLLRTETVRQTIRSALIYPAVLLATAAGSILLVLLVVLPQLEPVFTDTGAALPAVTRLAFALSHLLRNYWWAIGLGSLVMGFAMRQLLADPAMQLRRDAWLLRLPLLGPAWRRAETGRFAQTLGALLAGGVSLPAGLVLARPVLANRVVADAIGRMTLSVREGGSFAGAMARCGLFPELALQMIRVGEATGRLDAMLTQLAKLLEADVTRTLNRGLSLLVPGLTIVLGLVVAGIIASVMLAVLSVNEMVR